MCLVSVGENMIDKELLKNIIIRKIHFDEPVPYGLMLDADPSWNAVSKYLAFSEIHVGLQKREIIASIVLYMPDADTLEIKNIAVNENLQGKGIGQKLLDYATRISIKKNIRTMIIGTSNSSIGQLYLYQKAGFEMTEIRENFFLYNYPEPIFENGIQCRHMIMLKKYL